MTKTIASILPIVVTAVVTAFIVIGIQTHAAVRQITLGVGPVKTGMELVSKSTDGVVEKYVDYDASVVCYRTEPDATYRGVALSCLHQ